MHLCAFDSIKIEMLVCLTVGLAFGSRFLHSRVHSGLDRQPTLGGRLHDSRFSSGDRRLT